MRRSEAETALHGNSPTRLFWCTPTHPAPRPCISLLCQAAPRRGVMAIPVPIILCLVALAVGLLIYVCLRRAQGVGRSKPIRESRCPEEHLPGSVESGQRVTYWLLNTGDVEAPGVEYPDPEDADRDPVLQEFRLRNIDANLTQGAQSLIRRIRDNEYRKYIKNVKCCYVSPSYRCACTASELLKIGKEFSRDTRQAECNRTTSLECLSPYGIVREHDNGVFAVASRHCDALEDAVHAVGTYECSVKTLSRQKVRDRCTRSYIKRYTQQCVFALTEDLTRNHKDTLDETRTSSEETVVLVVGQTPYINMLAAGIAGVLGYSVDVRDRLEEWSFGELEGCLIRSITSSAPKDPIHTYPDAE
eukprot:TRINITY_DN14539_c0_g1_i1.p1 TRINITY_DN14539_c0_g1~~TRINITY_DN14539_c0_g1_i1.p1  ORF type:complete len:360 (+),score=74.94 TRINITY_DN14539_c0_g1_i1:500-1579(+)